MTWTAGGAWAGPFFLAFWMVLAPAVLAPVWSVSGHAAPETPETRSADQRFIDHGDGTLSDTETGLMWLKKDSYLDSGRWLDWRESVDYVRKLNDETFAGYIDWRMPTVDELQTLYEADKTNSAQVGSEMKIHIDPIFAKEGCGSLWSSETNGHFNSFGLIFNTGTRFNANKHSRGRKATRAVRTLHNPEFRKKHLDQ